MTDDVVERLARYVANHPGADVMEVLANVGVDPTQYRDIVEQLLASDTSDIHELKKKLSADSSSSKCCSGIGDSNGSRACGQLTSADPHGASHARTVTSPLHEITESDTVAGLIHHGGRGPVLPDWATADFANPNSGTWADELLEREQWMGHIDKKPFAPWADRDHPDADRDEDARWKWGITNNYVDGETIAMAEIDPRLDGRAFLQQEDDPYVYVDGDDVRDPETGEVHPAFIAILEHLGLTYADVSQSDAGVHAQYKGELPDGVKQASWRLDEDPWGSNEDLPSIEIYDGKRVCVATGRHVPGTPVEIREWNDDALGALLEANDQLPKKATREPTTISFDREDYDFEDYEPTASTSSETTSDMRDIFAAIDRLDAQRVAEKTIVQRWNDDASTSDGERAFWPTWGLLSDGGTANIVNEKRWQDTGDLGGYGGPVTMAAIDAGVISPANARPVDGADWWQGVEHLRKLGFDIPEYEPPEGDSDARPVSTLPIEQLDALTPIERRRFAKQRGLNWPSTDDARDRLFAAITEVIRNEDDRVVDAPTALGKTFTVASTRWGAREDITGERPVVQLLETRDARDEAIEVAEEYGGSHHVLLGRHEACPVAAGHHDDEITINGETASDWLDAHCNTGGKGMPFSAAHRYLEEHNDQGVELPCCEDSVCWGTEQWDVYREGPGGDLDYWPLVIATHNFAFAPGLRMQNNIVVDEEPDFAVDDLSTGRIREAVGAYLREIDAPVTTWEAFIQLSLHDGYEGDAARERDALEDAIRAQAERNWYFEDPDAHVLAPALARAIFYAEDRANGRRVGKTTYEPPRLEAQARDDDNWNREWVSVVLDQNNDVRSVRVVPDFSAARSVVGLDAHPAVPLWQANTVPWIGTKEVLAPTERRLWRRYERGLCVVQVGDATRPLSGGDALDWFDSDRKLDVILEHLVEEYGTQFRTAITTAQVENALKKRMEDVGCYKPSLMHFGEEKSRNDFVNQTIGLVNGCMDPGDDFVLDMLAELNLDAEVETAVDDEGEEYRARGRGFEGDDAETAAEILASVRENHIAQAAGRYARNADDPESTATVFVRTDAIPTGFADVQVSGAEWVFTDLQEEIVDELRETEGSLTARELADAVGCSKEHVRTTLERLAESDDGNPPVQLIEGAGDHGATLYSDSGLPHSGVCDTLESPTDPYRTTSRWVLAIRDPTMRNEVTTGGDDTPDGEQRTVWAWDHPPDPGA